MNKILPLSILLSLSLPLYAQELKSLLELRPGTKLNTKAKLEGSSETWSYEIDKKGNEVQSVSIDFKMPVDPSPYIEPKTEGHCFVQKSQHVRVYRYFFFDMKTKRRYELTPLKHLKSILIQNMPGAVEHKKCTFESFNLKEAK